jgi:hypothetical protein
VAPSPAGRSIEQVEERPSMYLPEIAWPTAAGQRAHVRARSRCLAVSTRIGHPFGMRTRASDPASPIPSAPFDDLDLDRSEDEEEWDRRLMTLASVRIAAERVRLEGLGIIDANGDLVSHELPSDMLPESDFTVDAG